MLQLCHYLKIFAGILWGHWFWYPALLSMNLYLTASHDDDTTKHNNTVKGTFTTLKFRQRNSFIRHLIKIMDDEHSSKVNTHRQGAES